MNPSFSNVPAGELVEPRPQTPPPASGEPFGYCLNTSTISGQKLGLVEELSIAAKAGFGGVEPWIEEIEAYVASGGSLGDLKKRIQDLGLKIPGAVGFAEWVVPDARQRALGLERLKKDMDLLAAIGGTHIACPPIGAHKPEHPRPGLHDIAERYHAILELGMKTGITPLLELWGFSKTLSRLSEVLYVAAEAAHPRACLLLDSYHLYKGGSLYQGVRLIDGAALPVFHINDYPATPSREQIDDSYRVYPGDGVAPLAELFRTLYSIGFRGFLSVELFNETYWKQPAEEVARLSITKTRAVVHAALGMK
jgi:2-keto-myo-inositol isomerase